MLKASFQKQLRDFSLDVSLDVQRGETLALLGENGAGKSTVLKILSGLVKPESGKIELNGETLFDRAADVCRDPEVRGIGYMFQNYALFPHMSVRENIRYGCPKDAAARADELIRRMGLSEVADEPVTRLSGGQRQRVALARALAPRPSLLLLDEPLAALDVKTQEMLRRELAATIRAENIPCILVTHSITDALTIADRVAVIERGKITVCGTPEDVVPLFAPAENPNIFRGTVWVKETGAVCVRVGCVDFRAVTALSGTVSVSIRPEELILSRERFLSSAVNVFEGRITGISGAGQERMVTVDIGIPLAAAVTVQSVERLGLAVGGKVTVTCKATSVQVFV
ncbi:MAG: ABC transporter ATP-binding protein [Methanocorpusculum sp.]|nr:ABC transporter ATP-binding protein [Methanocorpusculum sp.]